MQVFVLERVYDCHFELYYKYLIQTFCHVFAQFDRLTRKTNYKWEFNLQLV